jgi:hypothetical protein
MSKELGERFVQELLSKLPEAARAGALTALTSPDATAALEFAGSRMQLVNDAAERQAALEQKETRLTAWHGQLDTWRRNKEAEFTQREAELGTRKPTDGGNQPPAGGAPEGTMTAEQIADITEKVLAAREPAYVAYVAEATQLGAFHLRNFNQELDVMSLIQHPKVRELGLKGVYELVHQEQLTKLKADQAAAERNKLETEIRTKVEQEFRDKAAGTELPYPLGEGSPLDFLSMPADKRPTGDPAAAARAYEQLVTSGQGRG